MCLHIYEKGLYLLRKRLRRKKGVEKNEKDV